MSEPTRLAVEAFGHWLLGWTLVVLGVAAWIGLMRPKRASVRYTGWLLATFAGLALAPVVLAVGPLASWRALMRLASPRATPVAAVETVASSPSWFEGEPAAIVAASVVARREEETVLGPAAPAEPSPATGAARTVPDAQAPPDRGLALALALWASGFAAFAARLAWSASCVRRLLAGATAEVPAELAEELDLSRRELGIRRRVRMAVHPEIAAPLCVGLLRPVILWPSTANCPMAPRQRLASLVHELAHLRHGDDAIALLAEVWRAVAWFFPLVHVTVARLRAEREFRCDDLAAARLEAPEQYAEWLLDLAPIRVGVTPPLLASSLLGRTSMADRVARIVRGETRWAGPLGRRARALMTLAALLMLAVAGSVRLVGFSAAAQGPADAPLPEITPAKLAARIRESMARYEDRGTARVLFTDTRNRNFLRPGEPDWVSYRGRARFEGDGTRWRVEHDSMIPNANVDRIMPRLSPDRWSTGFDGERLYDFQVSRNTLQLGATTISAMLWKPRYLIWERSQDLPETLEGVGKQEVSISQRLVDGVRCYVVESRSTTAPGYGGEWLLAPNWGYLPISRKWTHNGKAYSIRTMQDMHEAAPGIWAPERIEEESLNVSGAAPRLDSRRRIQIVEFNPRTAPPASTFVLKIPYGVDVVELANGWSYHNDPWWPDVAPMLRDKHGWPRANLSWLEFLGSASERKIDGEPAPPLRIKEWINTKPMDLASLRGKVILIEFGSVLDNHYAPRYAVGLRELYAAYHPAGLEVLSIHAPGSDVAEIRRFAKDYRLPYPIVLDDDRIDPAGDTAKALAIRGRICAFLIDHDGKIRSVGASTPNGGRVVETVVSALQKAGARDVKPVSLEIPRLPDAAYQDVEVLFQAKAKEALGRGPSGKITGRVLDDKGKPIVGATVRASLQCSFLIFAEPAGYFLSSYQRPEGPFTAESDSDGRFEIPGLCKGGYLVKVTHPGRAWTERKVFLGPDLAPATADFELKQGDAIAGVVRDKQGKPVPGATVKPNARQNFVGDEYRSTSYPKMQGVTTDDEGRFRFSELQEGRYLFKVEAPGFKLLQPDAIPAGTQDATLTLEP